MNRVATIVQFAAHRQARAAAAQSNLLDILSTDLPTDFYIEEGSGATVLLDADWRRMTTFFDAFGLKLSREVSWSRLVDLWAYLRGEVGSHVRLLLRNERVFRVTTPELAPDLLLYVEALARGDGPGVAAFASKLDLWLTCPEAPGKVDLSPNA